MISVRRPFLCAAVHSDALNRTVTAVSRSRSAQSRMSDAPSLQEGTALCSGRYHVQKEINSELIDVPFSLIFKLTFLYCLQGEGPPLSIKVWTAYKLGQWP